MLRRTSRGIAAAEIRQMPRKNETKRPQALIDKAVKRHMQGEAVVSLAKELKVTKATLYNHVAAYKRGLLEQASLTGAAAHDPEIASKQTLIAEIQALKLENAKLGRKVIALMLKAGEL